MTQVGSINDVSSLPRCRFCASPLRQTFVDLGTSPLCQSTSRHEAHQMEKFYPLHAYVCGECFLVQLAHDIEPGEIFTSEYAYFSSFSDSWLAHAAAYVEKMTERLQLSPRSRVVELASNDGYLLQYFVKRGIPVLGVEPSANVAAEAAIAKGVPTVVRFFGQQTARELVAEYGKADLMLGNNVLAHVPDLNDFVAGIKLMLGPAGVLTMEFPHLQKLMEENQFDTIYHEHFSYFSFTTVAKSFRPSRHDAFRRRGRIAHAWRLAPHLRPPYGMLRKRTRCGLHGDSGLIERRAVGWAD